MESVGLPARGGMLWGIHVRLPVLEKGEYAGQGHLVHSQLVATLGLGQISYIHIRTAKLHIFPLPAKSFSSILYFGREF